MSDEKYYVRVNEELTNDKVNKALWTKAMMLSDNDKTEAKAKYIPLRIEQLKDADKKKVINKSLPAVAVLVVTAILLIILFL